MQIYMYTHVYADRHLKCLAFVIVVGATLEITSDLKGSIEP